MGHPISAVGHSLKGWAILASVIATVIAAFAFGEKENEREEESTGEGKYDGWDDALGV